MSDYKNEKLEKKIEAKELMFWRILPAFIFVIGLILGFFLGKSIYNKPAETIFCNFSVTETTEKSDTVWQYLNLPKQYSDYICEFCEKLDVDSDLAVAILLKENPELNEKATHVNENGTIDCGLFQLNDRYAYTDFVNDYWNFEDVEFDIFNWKMNTFIALRHIQKLSKSFLVLDDVICAYNCGSGAVMNHRIPDSTYQYLATVKNTYMLLRGEK